MNQNSMLLGWTTTPCSWDETKLDVPYSTIRLERFRRIRLTHLRHLPLIQYARAEANIAPQTRHTITTTVGLVILVEVMVVDVAELMAATTTGVPTLGAVIVGAVVITVSPLQSEAAMALSVMALMAADAPAILVAMAVAMSPSAALTLKLVLTETVPESRRRAAESRRPPTVKPVMEMSEAGTDRAAAKPASLAAL